MNAKNNTWQMAGDDILSSCLTTPDLWEHAYLKLGLIGAHFENQTQREVFDAIITLRKQDKPLVDTLILSLCGSSVTLDYIGILVNLADDLRLSAFDHNVRLVRDFGIRRKMSEFLERAKQKLDTGAHWQATNETIIKVLTSLGQNTEIADVTASAHADELATIMNNPPAEGFRSYVDFFDNAIHGLGKQKFIGLVAPYKSRKTTVALNLIVGSILGSYFQTGECPSIAFMSGEMLAHEISSNIVAMIAVGLLHNRGLANRTDDKGILHSILSGEYILRHGEKYRRWHPDKVQAIDDAFAIYKNVFAHKLRIYDKRQKHGGITSVSKLDSCIRRDIALYKPDVVVIDYLQVFSTETERDDDFERLRITSAMCQEFVKSQGVTIVGLAQMNEVGVNGGDGYSAHVKGGGALSQNIDYLVQSFYKTTDLPSESKLRLVVKLGRSVGNADSTVDISPQSGLILQNNWVSRLNANPLESEVKF